MTLVFDENNPITLDSLYIKGIIVDYNYSANNFPIIYVTVALPKELRELMIANEKTGTVIFKLQKYISNGDNPGLKMDCFEGKFIYTLPPSASSNSESRHVENPENLEDIAYTYTIGLAKVDHVNASKKYINNIIKEGSLSSIIYYILRGQNLLMEPLDNNKTIKDIILPPQGSIPKSLKYLNSLHTFYPSGYRFFMDFDIAYLLSQSSKITKRKGEKTTDVLINIRNMYDEANMEGMITNRDINAYVLNVSGTFCKIANSYMANRGYNEYAATNTIGETSSVNISDNSGTELTNKKTLLRLPNGNNEILSTIENENKLRNISISISSTKVDSTIFTPNKKYMINTDKSHGTEYTGQYLLTNRKDIYVPEGEGLNLNINLTFNKLP